MSTVRGVWERFSGLDINIGKAFPLVGVQYPLAAACLAIMAMAGMYMIKAISFER